MHHPFNPNFHDKTKSDSYRLVRDFLFGFDAETVHTLTLRLLHHFPNLSRLFFPIIRSDRLNNFYLNSKTMGHHITWKTSLGIAAGLDKNAECLDFFQQIGVGAIEVGTVTPLPQKGNQRPRLFRDPQNGALINRMGFPSQGMHEVKKNIIAFKEKISMQNSATPTLHLAINIGKQKETPLEKAYQDYLQLLEHFHDVADAIVVNISSPNTLDLRRLQTDQFLIPLLSEVANKRNQLAHHFSSHKLPLLLKVSPDEHHDFYEKIVSSLLTYEWQGMIYSNTTTRHNYHQSIGLGGLSGQPLLNLATTSNLERLRNLSRNMHHAKLDLIYSGGIFSLKDISNLKKQLGNHAPIFYQCYTGFIYQATSLYPFHPNEDSLVTF